MATRKKGPAKGPKVGGKAPDLKLKDQDGNEISLHELRGRRVLLSFHPLAFTGVCELQMKALEKDMDKFVELNTVPLGISVDSVPTKKAWAKSMGVEELRLMSDFNPKGQAGKRMGLYLAEHGIDARANVILDEKGNVVWAKVYELSELPDIKEVLAHLKKMEKKGG